MNSVGNFFRSVGASLGICKPNSTLDQNSNKAVSVFNQTSNNPSGTGRRSLDVSYIAIYPQDDEMNPSEVAKTSETSKGKPNSPALGSLAQRVHSFVASFFKRSPVTAEQLHKNPDKYLLLVKSSDLRKQETFEAVTNILNNPRASETQKSSAQKALINFANDLLSSQITKHSASDTNRRMVQENLQTKIGKHIAHENLPSDSTDKMKEALASPLSSKKEQAKLQKLDAILSVLTSSLGKMPVLNASDSLEQQQHNLEVPLSILHLTSKLTRFLKDGNNETKASAEGLTALLLKADNLQRAVLDIITPSLNELTTIADKIYEDSKKPTSSNEPPAKYETAKLRTSFWRQTIAFLLSLPLDSIKDAQTKATLEMARKAQSKSPLPKSIY